MERVNPRHAPVTSLDQVPEEHAVGAVGDLKLISLDKSAIGHVDDSQDRYEWAVLYENQRGCEIISVSGFHSLT